MGRNWDDERTLAAAEADAREEGLGTATACACGSPRFVLAGFFEVEDGQLSREPSEIEALTCPECGREYEAIVAGGRIVRGEFLGFFEEEET